MNQYVTGAVIKELREKNKMTQLQLADILGVSDKTVSKWETAKGYPDITLLEPIADAFSISVTELISGNTVYNSNASANMLKSVFYVCPICGNIIASVGAGSFSWCGITLPKQEAEESDENHAIQISTIDNEYHVSLEHPMDKKHYISFVAYVTSDTIEMAKLYPQQDISVRFRKKGHGYLYVYCNRHGMFRSVI